ncbi:MAG: anthranilate synthase component I family protein [SAR324 cluster bacterium]|nr:anthranilate synthase component I family protein [SAR324 cluster bacterium]
MLQANYSFVDLIYRLPMGQKGVFATSGAKGHFPELLAFDPLAEFVLTAANLDLLPEFISTNKGNLIGFNLSYDLGLHLEEINKIAKAPEPEGLGEAAEEPKPEEAEETPKVTKPEDASEAEPAKILGVFYAYAEYICFKKDLASLFFKGSDFPEKVEALSNTRLPREKIHPLELGASWSQETYKEKFDQVIEYIKAGDIYQVNLTQKIEGEFLGRGVDLFCRLTEVNQPLFGGYFSGEDFEFLSQSPELFLKTQGPRVLTQPIKGTRPKGENEMEQKKSLLNSVKEESELFMITDLLRNDLSKVCKAGTVKVNKHKELLSLNEVIHSFSEIEGRLKPDKTPLDLLLGAFPGGSVTGCPKRRAMEIIEELEDGPRGYYTGAFGFFDAHGDLNCSINIRSFVKQGDQVNFYVGGGVTALSQWEEEYAEMEHKKNSVIANLDQ